MDNPRPSTSSAITTTTNFDLIATEEKLNRRGFAVIFNNEKFNDSLYQKEREGTENDVMELKNVFEQFNIDVDVKRDFTLNQIQEEVKILSKFDFTPFECFIIVILSHGKENNILYAHDWYYNLNETIVYPIVNTNKSLEGKPKIFIIQACKGSMDPKSFNQIDASCSPASIQIPTIVNMYFAFSTFEGFVARRDARFGAIFIQKFCVMLKKYGSTESITTIMERVTNGLMKEIQVPMVLTTMSKPFRFGDIGRGMRKKMMIDSGKDCFTKLPKKVKFQMILEIFTYLSWGDLKDASGVCKQWNNAFKHSKTQNKFKLVLNEHNFKEFQENFKERNFYNVHFDRINFALIAENMEFLEKLMKNLQYLSFNGCQITEYQLLSILQMTKNLKILKILKIFDWKSELENGTKNNNYNFDNLTNVKHFEMSELNENTSNCFHELLTVMQNLEVLLVHKDNSFQIPNNSLKMSAYLSRLEIMGNGQIDFTGNTWKDYLYKHIRTRALNLKSLEVKDLDLVKDVVRIYNLKLEKLIISEEIQPTLLNRVVSYQPSITHLEIQAIVENTDLITICKNLRNLKFLKIGNCRKVDDSGVKYLWKLKQLKSLFLFGCEKMTTRGFTNGLREKNDDLQTLKLWRLNSCENLLMHITNKFVHLRQLILSCESGIREKQIQNIWRNLRWLKKLIIRCNEVTVTDFAYTGERIQNESEINGCSIANVKGLEHLELRFQSNITILSLQEIAKLKELVYFRADFSCSEIEIKDLNILISCKSLDTIYIQLSQEFIHQVDKKFLKHQFHRIKTFQISSQ